MSIPKEPRQQMINMMYLVLTALLALNVSAEILNAFKLVSDGMNTSNRAMDKKNVDYMAAFNDKFKVDPGKVAKYYDDAKKAEALSATFIEYVKGLQKKLIDESGGVEVDETKDTTLKGKKNYDVTTNLMIEKKEGDKLRKEIEKLRDGLLALPSLSPGDKDMLAKQMTLSTFYNEKAAKKLGKKNWEAYHFDHVPVIAANTLLTKFKGDAINSSGLVIETLFKKIGEKDYSFNALTPMVNANSNYVLAGQEYNAKVYLSAYSTTIQPEILLGPLKPGLKRDENNNFVGPLNENPVSGGGTKLPAEKVINGQGVISEVASGAGERVKTGAIKVLKPNSNEYEYYPFEMKYVAAEAAVVVSPDKMNVFYIGVENPVSISVPGYGSDKITASLTKSGSISGSGGKYIVKVTAPGETEVVVSAKGDDGKMKSFPGKKFRIKRVPDPIAKVGNSPGGKIPANQFKVQKGVNAVLENFDFELKFKVISFDMTYAAKRQDLITKSSKSPNFTPEMLDYLSKAKPGDVFYIDDIRVQGPDGATRKLPSIVFQLI
ncbi:MAG: GldM family protein [Chitinophagales bacterium]|nr:GldM family protein [Chitinophagales bacterium]